MAPSERPGSRGDATCVLALVGAGRSGRAVGGGRLSSLRFLSGHCAAGKGAGPRLSSPLYCQSLCLSDALVVCMSVSLSQGPAC